ncbi:MAG: response regulator [Lachnospiraceae bacterium]|nr:response regulator [Lachnospiraceae bacterium]
MHIIAVDDEGLARQALTMALQQVFPEEEIHSFGKAKECMECVNKLMEIHEEPEYAFLDIQLRGYTGIELAKEIKDVSPGTTIIFVTAYNDYASEAFGVQASGYLLKPVDAEAIQKVVDTVTPAREQVKVGWNPVGGNGTDETCLSVVTFGKFAAFVNREELKFERSKSKELLALLVDKRGAGLSNSEIEMYLWEDTLGDKRKNSYVQKVIGSMMKTLREAGVDDIIEKRYNYLALRPEKIRCDLYAFLQGDTAAVNSYYGIYMEDYSWGEPTIGLLEQWK